MTLTAERKSALAAARAAHQHDCRYHCRSCESCFLTLDAFDAHRAGSHKRNTRHCLRPDTVEELEAIPETACRIGARTRVPTTTYRLISTA